MSCCKKGLLPGAWSPFGEGMELDKMFHTLEQSLTGTDQE